MMFFRSYPISEGNSIIYCNTTFSRFHFDFAASKSQSAPKRTKKRR